MSLILFIFYETIKYMSNGLKETIKTYVKNSKPNVEEFVKYFSNENDEVIYPETIQDKLEHWDVKINGQKYDPKALKKILRSDDDVSKIYHWIEMKNGDGYTGWLYSSPDVHLVFETIDEWILVKKDSLIPLIEQKCEGGLNIMPYPIPKISKHVKLYIPYRRFKREDSIVLATIEDIKSVAYKILKKS